MSFSALEITHQTPPMQTRHIKSKSNTFYVTEAFSFLSFSIFSFFFFFECGKIYVCWRINLWHHTNAHKHSKARLVDNKFYYSLFRFQLQSNEKLEGKTSFNCSHATGDEGNVCGKVHWIRSVLVGAICGPRWRENSFDYTTIFLSSSFFKVIKTAIYCRRWRIEDVIIFRVDSR